MIYMAEELPNGASYLRTTCTGQKSNYLASLHIIIHGKNFPLIIDAHSQNKK